jgi:hypothetical protein
MPLEEPVKCCLTPLWAIGIEREYEQLTNVGILATNKDAEYDLFNKEKEGANNETDEISSLFSAESKQNSRSSHGTPVNVIDNINWKNTQLASSFLS